MTTPGCSPVRDTSKTVQENTEDHAFVRGTEKSLYIYISSYTYNNKNGRSIYYVDKIGRFFKKIEHDLLCLVVKIFYTLMLS